MDLLLAYRDAGLGRAAYQSEGAISPILGILFVLVIAGVILAYSYDEAAKRLAGYFHKKTAVRLAIFLVIVELVGMVYIWTEIIHI